MHTAQSPLDLYRVSAIEMVLVVILIKRFEVQDVRPVKGQYHLNRTAIWESIPGEHNGNVLKFLSAKELVRFKSICKNAKSAVKSEKGLLFDAVREQIKKIIKKCGFESVLSAFKFKVKNCIRLGGALGLVVYAVNTTKRCMQIIQARLCIPAGIPGIPRNPQEPGFQKKGTTFLFCRNV
jgi:hypothetical protein